MIQIALALMVVTVQSGQAADVTRELEAFEQTLAATWKSGDCDGWGRMLADDWSVIHITAEVMTRADALKICRQPRPAIDTFAIDQVAVRQFGDAAVVTGRTTIKSGGTDAQSLTLRFSDFFIRRDGRWQVVASHATRIGS
jgi:ketosteroid isomerase-like protein